MVRPNPELDQWKPGGQNGTFRGHNLAFATAAKALEHFWSDDTFAKEVQKKGYLITDRFRDIASGFDDHWFYLNGRGMMQGLACHDGELAEEITKAAFKRKLVLETSGADDQVIKTLCPLTVTEDEINHALDGPKESGHEALKDRIQRDATKYVNTQAD